MRLLLAASLAAILLTAAAVCWAQENVTIWVFGSSACPECCELKESLCEWFGGETVHFIEIMGNKTNLERFKKAFELAFPGEQPSYPLAGIFVGGRLVAVVWGNPGRGVWSSLVVPRETPVAVRPDGSEANIPVDRVSGLEAEFMGRDTLETPTQSRRGEGLVAAVLSAAAADSINPCTFSVFTALTLLAAAAGGRRKAVYSGAAFVAAVFLAYTALGFGLIRVFSYVPWIRYAVGALGVAVGSYEVLTSLGGGFRSPLPGPLYRATSGLVDRMSSSASVPLSFLGGLLISVTLLPCSSGPYLVAVSLLSELDPATRTTLLLAYNSVFVAPLVAILGLIVLLERWERRLKRWRTRGLGPMNAVAGALLVAISLYAIFG